MKRTSNFNKTQKKSNFRVNVIFPLTLVLFVLLEIFLIKNSQFTYGIYLYIIYGLTLFLIDKKLIISFFVYNLPLLPLILSDYKVFGFVGPHEIIYGFSILVLFTLPSGTNKKQLNKYQKISISFLYLLFFINFFVIVKDIYFELNPDKTKGIFYIFKIFVRLFLYYISLILLIKKIYNKGFFDYIFVGIKYAILTIPISMIFTKALVLMGAGVVVFEKKTESLMSGDYNRYIGLYGAGGDENSAGIFLVAAFGFLLALYEKTGNIKKYIIFMGCAVLGILLSGSRTAFMALIIVILLFLVTNKSAKGKIYILLAVVLFYFIFNDQISLVFERFLDPSAKKAVDSNQMGRIGKWILYVDWILNNPETLFYGNQRKINYHRAPHNYFIWVVYHVGIIPFLILSGLLLKLIKSISFSMKPTTLKNVYYVLPFLFIIITVNSFGSSIYLWIYLPIGAFFISSDSENIKLSKKYSKKKLISKVH